MAINQYVLIDFENVQPATLDMLSPESFYIILFVGATQSKIPIELAMSMQRYGPRATYVRLSGNGANALDFHIAYYVGKLTANDPEAYVHIISKDTGFDPLLDHLKSKKLRVRRWNDIGDIPTIKASSARSCEERVEIVLAQLTKHKNSKPRSVDSLKKSIAGWFQGQLSEADLMALIAELRHRGIIVVADDLKVSYYLPDEANHGPAVADIDANSGNWSEILDRVPWKYNGVAS